MTRAEIQHYFEKLAQQYPLDPLVSSKAVYRPSGVGSVSDDLQQYRGYGMVGSANQNWKNS
jgi:hypothetical protein